MKRINVRLIAIIIGCFALGIAVSFLVRSLMSPPPELCWGMSPAQVKRLEDAALIEESGAELSYTVTDAEFPIAVKYRFVEHRLVEITRVSGQHYTSLEDALKAIGTLLKTYKHAYGALSDEMVQPHRLEFVWTTSDAVISVTVWYVEEAGAWTWAATDIDVNVANPAYERVEDTADRT